MDDKTLLRSIEQMLDTKLDDKLNPVYERLDRVDQRLDKLETRLETVEVDIKEIKEDLNELHNGMNAVVGWVDKIEQKQNEMI